MLQKERDRCMLRGVKAWKAVVEPALRVKRISVSRLVMSPRFPWGS